MKFISPETARKTAVREIAEGCIIVSDTILYVSHTTRDG